MNKKEGLFFICLIALILLTKFSAAYISGGYNNLSFSDLLNSINASNMILGSIFIIAFAFLNFSLSKFFKEQKAIAGIVAFVLSLLIVWEINNTGLDFESFFYNAGISSDSLFLILPLIITIGTIYSIWKFGFSAVCMVFGAFILAVTIMTDWIYSQGTAILIGSGLLIIGIWNHFKKNNSKNKDSES